MKVYINPGHDVDYDSGAVNPNTGLRECDVALKIGRLVKGYLKPLAVNVGFYSPIIYTTTVSMMTDRLQYVMMRITGTLTSSLASIVMPQTATPAARRSNAIVV